ncbi:hypothetical protein [Streptacidiphilus rugosus]|uniref:hypothetical protein n=1 Tax=Streptacidiphilus rugosus TaxID=405783 RepID=UPI00056B53E9|nr:hypothetical protein [Streptacidiphilus rugosus]
MHHRARLLLAAVAVALTAGCATAAPAPAHTPTHAPVAASSSATPAAVLAQRQAETTRIAAVTAEVLTKAGFTAEQQREARQRPQKHSGCGENYFFLLPAKRYAQTPAAMKSALAGAGFHREIAGPNDIRMLKGAWESWISTLTVPAAGVQGDVGFTGDALTLTFSISSGDKACLD